MDWKSPVYSHESVSAADCNPRQGASLGPSCHAFPVRDWLNIAPALLLQQVINMISDDKASICQTVERKFVTRETTDSKILRTVGEPTENALTDLEKKDRIDRQILDRW